MPFDALPPNIAERATQVYECARSAGKRFTTFLVADMNEPASQKRLYVFDATNPHEPTLIARDYVSHGAGSDRNKDGVAEAFGNTPNSNRTSLGLYRIAERYHGKYGASFRLDGLSPGWNDAARERAVVLHPAPYVRPGFAGRSLGCPAVRDEVLKTLDQRKVANDALLWIDGPGLEISDALTCPPAFTPPADHWVCAVDLPIDHLIKGEGA